MRNVRRRRARSAKRRINAKTHKEKYTHREEHEKNKMTDEARAARKSPLSKRGGGETLLSCLVVLVSLFVVVDDAKSSLLANNGIPSSLSSSSSSKMTTTNNNNTNHKYAFTPTNGKILYSWVAKGRALPSERSAKSVDAGAKERDAVEGTSSSSSSWSEFKYMHMAMPTILPDGSIAVGAFVLFSLLLS